jgi:hypothetical protein
LATIRSVQSSRAAISTSLRPSAANNTILARITSRYGRVYCAARRRNSRSSTSVIFNASVATGPRVRRGYDNSFNRGERISVSPY